MKKISIASCIIFILLASLLTFQLTYSYVGAKFQEKMDAVTDTDADFTELEEARDTIINNFVGNFNEDQATQGSIRGMVASLGDPYSRYLTAEEYTAYKTEKQGIGVGIGIRVVYDENEGKDPIIYSVFPSSPAQEAGIQKGDALKAVNGKPISELGAYEAVNQIGGEVGTSVTVTLSRRIGNADRNLEFTVMRRELTIPTVDFFMLEGNVAFIQIYSFGDNTAAEFNSALDQLLEVGAEALILDVRDNSGGRLDSALSIADRLLPAVPIYRIADRFGKEEVISGDDTALDLPIALLMNSDSASASEVLAAALKDHEKAVLVGTKTFGKGTAQTILELSDGSAIILSTKKFMPPVSPSYEGIGVEPDVEVDIGDVNFYLLDPAEDRQIQAALEAVLQKEGG